MGKSHTGVFSKKEKLRERYSARILSEKGIQAGCRLIADKVKNVQWLQGNRQPRLS